MDFENDYKLIIIFAILEMIFVYSGIEAYQNSRKEGESYTESILGATFVHIIFSFIFCGIPCLGIFEFMVVVYGYVSFIVLMIVCLLCIAIRDKIHDKIRNEEMKLIPERIEKYIMCNGFTAPHLFKKSSEEQPEFATTRSVQYINPVYMIKAKENRQRKANNQKPIEITDSYLISYSSFAEYKYKEAVLTRFMVELPKVMYTIFMFDYENLYDSMTTFQNFFKKENDTVDMIYFKQACHNVINEALDKNTIEKVGGNDNLFRSKIIPEDEGNIVEGDIIEL